MYPVLARLIDRTVILILRIQTATRGPQHNARVVCQFASKGQTGLTDRFAGGQQCKLREPIIKGNLLAVEMVGFVIAFDLPPDLDRQPRHILDLKRPNPAAPFLHGGKGGRHISPQWVDRARSGDHHTVHLGGLLGDQFFDSCNDGSNR